MASLGVNFCRNQECHRTTADPSLAGERRGGGRGERAPHRRLHRCPERKHGNFFLILLVAIGIQAMALVGSQWYRVNQKLQLAPLA
jgi:hypothetical protein